MICVHAVAVRNIRIAADGTNRNNVLQLQPDKVGEKLMIETDQFKFTLNQYRQPLMEVRDSL